MRPQMIRVSQTLALVVVGVMAAAVLTLGQAQNSGPIMRFTATSENVSGAPDTIRIDLLRWSTDAERDQFLTAWTSPAPAAPAAGRGAAGAGAPGAGGGGGGGGRGGGRGGARGAAPTTDDAAGGARGAAAPDANGGDAAAGGRGARGAAAGARGDAPAAAAPDAAAGARGGDAAAANAAGGRGGAAAGGGGRGGRGGGAAGGGRGGRGGDAAPAVEAPPPTPEGSFLAALQRANTVGYLWTSEAAGYSLRFAYRYPQPDGTERIVLATDRRLGSWNGLWKPNGTVAANDYQFTVIELRLNAKGEGEGKASLSGKVAPDTTAKAVLLDGYATMPIVLKAVKRSQ